MFKAFKRWLAKAAYDELQEQARQNAELERINKLHDMFHNNIAAVTAFKIDNGYVVRVIDTQNIRQGAHIPGFVYCADHKAIADYLIASAAREKLGIQLDLFEQPQYAVTQTSGHGATKSVSN